MSSKPNIDPNGSGEGTGTNLPLPRMRTIKQAAEWLRKMDPECALTPTALRRFVVTGVIPSVRNGTKYLVALEAIIKFLSWNNY